MTCSGSTTATWRGSSSATRTFAPHMVAGVAQYADDVRNRRFPAPEHFYSIDEQELAQFTAGV